MSSDSEVLAESLKPLSVVECVRAKSFLRERHFYDRALNAQLHPLVAYFLHLGIERMISRYCHLHPKVSEHRLESILRYQPKYLRWGGVDLFNVTSASGLRQMAVVETNSCPSGQKSMPLSPEHSDQAGYQYLVENCFIPALQQHPLKQGGLAVIYDKNYMEASGYAAALADAAAEPVHLVPFFDSEPEPPARFVEGILEIRTSEGEWVPIRGAFRYVTQRPWNRIPLHTKTLIFNPVLACLAGGRNKLVAAMAYDLFNAELVGSGLKIVSPETIRDVGKQEVPLMVKRFGGRAVVKVPYANAGQGVHIITTSAELESFMETECPYEQYIVQSLIGNYHWSSSTADGRLFHIGTVPDSSNRIYAADLRMMVVATKEGFHPLASYARRAAAPLEDSLQSGASSWSVLGTNLSINLGPDRWDTETDRLMLMDKKDFNQLGLGLDDLIKGFVQAVLAIVAIDQMAATLTTKKGKFRSKLFRSINNDDTLLGEMLL